MTEISPVFRLYVDGNTMWLARDRRLPDGSFVSEHLASSGEWIKNFGGAANGEGGHCEILPFEVLNMSER